MTDDDLVAKNQPANFQGLFELLARDLWIEAEQVPPLQRIAGFRNLLAHGHGRIDLLASGRPRQQIAARLQLMRIDNFQAQA